MSRAVYRLPTVKTHKGAVAKFLSHLTQLKIEVIHAFMDSRFFSLFSVVHCHLKYLSLKKKPVKENLKSQSDHPFMSSLVTPTVIVDSPLVLTIATRLSRT